MLEVLVIIVEYCLFDLDVLIMCLVVLDVLFMLFFFVLENEIMMNLEKILNKMCELVEF